MRLAQDAVDALGTSLPRNLVLFDGVCHMCNGRIQFVMKNTIAPDMVGNGRFRPTPERTLRFAPLQSKEGAFVTAALPETLRQLDSIYLVERTSASEVDVYVKSAAAFRIGMKLDSWYYAWLATAAYYALPSAVADVGYDAVAARRYEWWGKAEQCFPTTHVTRKYEWKLSP
jgi:predicted DCC family thiol-disulfide oxidoreductase YuxK